MRGIKQSIYTSQCDVISRIRVDLSYEFNTYNLRGMLMTLFKKGGYPDGCRVEEESRGRYLIEYISDTRDGKHLTPQIILGFLRGIEADVEEVLRMKRVAGLLKGEDDA